LYTAHEYLSSESGAVSVVYFSLYFVPRGHKGSRPKRKNYKTGGGGGCEVSHWIMIATCSFLHRNQPFFTTKEFFPHPPRRKKLAVHTAYYIIYYIVYTMDGLQT